MRLINRVLACAIALILAVPLPARSQSDATSAPPFTAEQLDQIVAPIALYPDPLLAQVLMASTYPIEVVQAARFVKENPGLTADRLDEALKQQPWDDSVKSLVTFPQVLDMMDTKLDWTQKLGDAFLGSEKEVMDAVQRLRARAQAEGNLNSTSQQTVTVEPAAAPIPPAPGAPQQVIVQQAPPTVIAIQPANPQVVYVPTYNPTVVYGAWPYPAYPPYAYYPPGFVAGAALFSFAAGVAVGGALWGNCNWRGGSVNVNVNQYNSFTRNVNQTNIAASRTQIQGNNQNWQHNPQHRGGAQYRDQATQQRYNRGSNPQAVQSRENFRGRAEQGRQELNRGGAEQFRQGGTGARQTGAQPRQGSVGGATGAQRGGASPGSGFGAQQGAARPQGGAGASGRSPQQTAGRPQGGAGVSGGGSAFQGMGQGREVQNYSNRGQSSRQTMSAPRGGSAPSGAAAGGAARGGGGGTRSGGGGGGGGGARGGGGRR